MTKTDSLVTFGSSVKALGNGKVGGYLVLFSTKNDPDLANDFFTSETDFDLTDGTCKSAVYFDHGLDATLGKKVLGIEKAECEMKDAGVWVEAQLNMRDEYEAAIYELAKKGKLGWSSGTASHLVEREAKGKANWVKRWPLGLDASLTATPCEPRTSAIPLKSITSSVTFDELKSGLTTMQKRKEFAEALEDLLGEGWIEDFDDDTIYFNAYGVNGLWAVPYSYSRGKLNLGVPSKVSVVISYEPVTKSVSSEDVPLGGTFSDLTTKTLGSLREFSARLTAYAEVKARDNRPISEARKKDIQDVLIELKALSDGLTGYLAPQEDPIKAMLIEQMRVESELLDLSLRG